MTLNVCPRCKLIMSRLECSCGVALKLPYHEEGRPAGPPQGDLFKPDQYQLPLRLDPG